MRVLQLLDSLGDGGAQTLVKEYALAFKKRSDLDIQCHIVTIFNIKDSANYQRLKHAGVNISSIYRIKHGFVDSAFSSIVGRYYIPYRLSKIIKRFKPDVIHVHMGLLRYLSTISDQLKGIKIFYTCHSEPKRYFEGTNLIETSAAYKLIKENNLKLIALHEDMKNDLNERFGVTDTIVVNNCVDINLYKGVLETKESIRASIGIDRDAFVVGHIGRFNKVKNHQFLLKVFSELAKEKDNARLLLIGEGPMRSNLLKQIDELQLKDRVIILSKRTDVPRLLKSMDIFIFPSLFEGLSLTLVEAQASGIRCLISDTINVQNILSQETSALSLSKSPKEWVRVILEPPLLNTNYGNIYNYDTNRVVEKLNVLYRSSLL